MPFGHCSPGSPCAPANDKHLFKNKLFLNKY
jgi:hypothetical protein